MVRTLFHNLLLIHKFQILQFKITDHVFSIGYLALLPYLKKTVRSIDKNI